MRCFSLHPDNENVRLEVMRSWNFITSVLKKFLIEIDVEYLVKHYQIISNLSNFHSRLKSNDTFN